MFVFVFALCLRSFDLLFSVYVFILVCNGMFSFMPGAEKVHIDIYICITTVSMFLFLVCVCVYSYRFYLCFRFVFASFHFAF